MTTTAAKLIDLLDYVEQVVKLDERVAFRLADHRLADGTVLAVADADIRGLPGITQDTRDGDGAVWLAVERLGRRDPPGPPPEIAPWVAVSPDPGVVPDVASERLATVTAAERAALVAAGAARDEDFAPVPERHDDGGAERRFDRRLRLGDQPEVRDAANAWVTETWAAWAVEERARRQTIALYGKLYKLQQLLELGAAEGAVEAVWGIGPVRWRRDGRAIDRPLLERGIEIELGGDGAIRVRPTDADARFDLKPYEEFGCESLNLLDDALRREVARTAADEGVSPFRRDTFEPALTTAAARFAPEGRYAPGAGAAPPGEGPVVSDGWVLFARPRTQHVVLDDIARFRERATAGTPVRGLAERLVTPPSAEPPAAEARSDAGAGVPAFGEVFFPKPFNDDQVAIVRRLARNDGLVVQGPPGTGKTHTIANLICHAMALGQRVLVVSRGEAALAVLRDQIPEKIRPLAIAILSNERAGLRQVETAIREIQGVVEESRPDIRASAIRRCEGEIAKIEARVAAIDREAEDLAGLQIVPLGPDAATPADLARRLGDERAACGWFTDRPSRFAADAGLTDAAMAGLRAARAAAAPVFDHVSAVPPTADALPDADEVAAWHDDLLAAAAATGAPDAAALRLGAGEVAEGQLLARNLRGFADACEALRDPALAVLVSTVARDDASPWAAVLRDLAQAWWDHEAERVKLAAFAVEMHAGLIDDPAACAAVERAAAGERPWPLMGLGLGGAKEIVAAVRVRGAAPGADAQAWRAVSRWIALLRTRRGIAARWRTFAAEASLAGSDDTDGLAPAARALAAGARVRAGLDKFGPRARGASFEQVCERPALARAVAERLEAAAAAARAEAVGAAVRSAAAAFDGPDRTAAMARRILQELVGRPGLDAAEVGALWAAALGHVAALREHAAAFATIRAACAAIAAAGAPAWAERLLTEPPAADADAALPADWRRAWDFGAAEAALAGIEARETLAALARERDAADRRGRKLFVELVRERAFHELERRLSPRVKSALVEYVRAVARLGKATGKGAGRNRRAARDAMARCYDAVPCWIMPTWRVAEQLPADLASFDLVILDEASQSDVTELPALLRGRKILAVGDDRQVSPTPPFVTQAKVDQLRHRYLRGLPYGALFEPGESLYDLLRAVFPDSRLMLKEHFRCVEPIIRFSMQFYPEKLVPLRVPSAAEKLDPPLVDIFVPHGRREGARKINRAEAQVIVDEIAALAADPATRTRSVGVISLVGAEQAELVRVMLAERIGEEAMQRHAVLCGNSAAFQGNERDIVFLSMVADRGRRTTLTALPYEQRFNVAASRARDRLVLVRSVEPADLSPRDLKARLIDHFADPFAAAGHRVRPAGEDAAAACESGFERDVMARLLAAGYAVEPQVGAQGFRIDLVVEGADGRRLAVECDGDAFHGPAQWRDDMRRQRILERVGWRFWRCFASDFYRDPERVTADLFDTLRDAGIEPAGADGASARKPVTVHRRAPPPAPVAGDEAEGAPRAGPPPAAPASAAVPAPDGPASDAAAAANAAAAVDATAAAESAGRIGVGDRVALLFPDRKRLTLRLTEAADDPARGLLSVASPLGRAVAASEEGEEIDVPGSDGAPTRVLVEAVERAA